MLGLPRGGIPVAYQIAHQLGLPLDVVVVRKVGAPGQPELAMGAVASGGVTRTACGSDRFPPATGMAAGRRRVHERFGVELEPEVQVLGEVEWPDGWRL